MEIVYAAHTASCTFLLDGDGFCRSVIPSRAGAEIPAQSQRCIGAQYVASLDLLTEGGLVAMPQQGSPLLFARIEANGRITLVRSGKLVRFEERAEHDRERDSGVRPRPSEYDLEDATIPVRNSLPPVTPPAVRAVQIPTPPAQSAMRPRTPSIRPMGQASVSRIPPPPALPRISSPPMPPAPSTVRSIPPSLQSAPTLRRPSIVPLGSRDEAPRRRVAR